jgi:hypothetical protein
VEAVTLTRLQPAEAFAMLAGVEVLDPRGNTTPDDLQRMCELGHCFAATPDGGGQAVYVLHVKNGQAWVQAAKGEGHADLTRVVLPCIELQADGLDSIGFQTARRGLVRKAVRQGYRVAGFMLVKDLKRWT